MPTRPGYLLPTREKIVVEPATGPLLDLAARAKRLGFSVAHPSIDQQTEPLGWHYVLTVRGHNETA